MVFVTVGGNERTRYVEEARMEKGYKEERIRKKKAIYRVEKYIVVK